MRKLSLFLLCILCASPLFAKPKQAPVPETSKSDHEPWLHLSISLDEQRILRDWQRSHPQDLSCGHAVSPKGLPHGQQKKLERTGQVSEGWQKKIARGETLPVDIYQQCRVLPSELSRRLPPAPAGTILIGIDGKAVRLLQATREIVDIFELR